MVKSGGTERRQVRNTAGKRRRKQEGLLFPTASAKKTDMSVPLSL